MAATKNYETTDVVIVGCGPTGALLTALLGAFDIPNVVLEREADITEDPRGIALDEDGIRLLQAVGIYDKVYTEIGSCLGVLNFIEGKNDLHTKPFMRVNLNTTEGGTGHVGVIGHQQPVMEKYLRLAASKHRCSQTRVSSTVTGIDEDNDWIRCEYSDASGCQRSIRSKFLVGADGKTGYVRKKYLEPKGVNLVRSSGFHYEEIWVALNWRITPPTKETHPDFPLWALDYSPEDIYELFFPRGFRFICDAARPAVCGRFGSGAQRLWRFEFVVKKSEDPMQMATRESIMEIILPYLTHSGSKYGLSIPSIQFPVDCVEVLRSRPFNFSARSCNKWSAGRVILAGDAAHVFPPFGGQGIVSGFRDASGLAWRLAIACQSNTKNYEHLLSGWYRERKQQLERSLATTVENGRLCTEGNTWRFAAVKWVLWCMQMLPSWRHWLEMGPRREGMIRYRWEDGLPFLRNWGGGMALPQVYCAPIEIDWSRMHSYVSFTDDVIFRPDKKGLFQLVVLLENLSELDSAREMLLRISQLSQRHVISTEATFILQNSEVEQPSPSQVGPDVFRLATPTEFSSSSLCNGRPPPQFYNMYRMKEDLRSKRFAVVRPDRFVYAACNTGEELVDICDGIQGALGLSQDGFEAKNIHARL